MSRKGSGKRRLIPQRLAFGANVKDLSMQALSREKVPPLTRDSLDFWLPPQLVKYNCEPRGLHRWLFPALGVLLDTPQWPQQDPGPHPTWEHWPACPLCPPLSPANGGQERLLSSCPHCVYKENPGRIKVTRFLKQGRKALLTCWFPPGFCEFHCGSLVKWPKFPLSVSPASPLTWLPQAVLHPFLLLLSLSVLHPCTTIFPKRIVVVESLSRVQLFATPWTSAHQTSLSFTISQTLFKLVSINSVMPSNHLILCHPLLLLLSLSQHQVLFQWVNSSHEVAKESIGVSASASVLPMNTQDWSPLGWTGWIQSPCSPRDS